MLLQKSIGVMETHPNLEEKENNEFLLSLVA